MADPLARLCDVFVRIMSFTQTVSRVRFGSWLYRFLIFAFLFTCAHPWYWDTNKRVVLKTCMSVFLNSSTNGKPGTITSLCLQRNILNSSQIGDEMFDKPCIFTLFLNSFDKFNNTWALMPDHKKNANVKQLTIDQHLQRHHNHHRYKSWSLCVLYLCKVLQIYQTTYEPWHVIFNNVAFWQV